MIIAVDFDGTIVTNAYPRVGRDIGACAWMKRWLEQDSSLKLILYTMRDGECLKRAVQYCRSQGVEFWSVNTNTEQWTWTMSPKVYAHLYIDDAAFGVPMIYKAGEKRGYVDWDVVGPEVLWKLGGPDERISNAGRYV